MDLQYKEMIDHVLSKGKLKANRTGVKTYSTFGYQARFDLTQGFPIQTTKKIHWKSVVHELLWFISGNTNVKYLQDNGVRIWNEWADENGELGPVYGKQWRKWKSPELVPTYAKSGGLSSMEYKTIDQLHDAIVQINTNPDSRRIIVSAWNPADIPQMKLPPCHTMFQFYVDGDDLSCQLYQRSADLFLGVPFNIASYALLTAMVAQVTNKTPKEFIHTFGDLHIYENHVPQCMEVLHREPRPLPTLHFDSRTTHPDFAIDDFKYEDIHLIGYKPHPALKAEVAV